MVFSGDSDCLSLVLYIAARYMRAFSNASQLEEAVQRIHGKRRSA